MPLGFWNGIRQVPVRNVVFSGMGFILRDNGVFHNLLPRHRWNLLFTNYEIIVYLLIGEEFYLCG